MHLTIKIFLQQEKEYVLYDLNNIAPNRTTSYNEVDVLKVGEHYDILTLGTHGICVDFINLDSDDEISDAMSGIKRESDDREWIRVGKVGKRKQRVDNKHDTQRKVVIIDTSSDSEDNILSKNPFECNFPTDNAGLNEEESICDETASDSFI
ncbi:uncharacterized protein LOC130644494 [Hydractinia symbiolongicarpus]|uniref:uncharacterized protein LOC130644494 n=1 Tax=Hydractinia symbiolongicarpus TaxID=13093 RepID=UPI00255103A9|nr:uncharacterized protein LOC130644494 [Hydractinia symbiolongicarpus]